MDTPDTPANVPPRTTPAVRPNGPAAAVMLAAGIGALVLGILTVLNEASEGIHEFLEFSERVGPLSGVTDLAATAFLLSWGGLHMALRERDFVWKTIAGATIAMFVISVICTYPAFFELFASD